MRDVFEIEHKCVGDIWCYVVTLNGEYVCSDVSSLEALDFAAVLRGQHNYVIVSEVNGVREKSTLNPLG